MHNRRREYQRQSRISLTGWGWIGSLGFALAVSWPALRAQVPRGHDLPFHLHRYLAAANAWADGQLVPQLDPAGAGGHGYAANLFYSPLTAWAAVPLHAVLGSWGGVVNALIVLCLLGSAATMYAFAHALTGRVLPAFLASALYVSAPYHLVDVWVRQAQGEVAAFVFLPLLLHGIHVLLARPRAARGLGILLLAAGTGGLLLSHLLSAAMGAMLAVGYLAFNARAALRWRTALALGLGCGLGVAASAVFLLPLWQAQRLAIYNAFLPDSEFAQRYSLQAPDRAVAVWRLLVDGPVTRGHVSTVIGVLLVTGVVVAVILYRRLDSVSRPAVWQFGALGVLCLVACTTIVPWALLPHAFWQVQFPWRFLQPATACLSVVAGIAWAAALDRFSAYCTQRARPRIVVRHATGTRVAGAAVLAVVCLVAVAGIQIDAVRQPAYPTESITGALPKGRAALASGEYLPAALDSHDRTFRALERRGSAVRVERGDAVVSGQARTGTESTVELTAGEAGATLQFPLVYYPSYRAELRSGDSTRSLRVRELGGFVAVELPAGASGALRVHYAMSGYTVLGACLSALAVLAWCTLAAFTVSASRKTAKPGTRVDRVPSAS